MRPRSAQETGPPRLEQPGRIKQEEPQPPDSNVQAQEAAGRPRLDHPGPHPPDWSVEGKVAAGSEGGRRPRPRSRSDADRTGCITKDKAKEMRRNRDEDAAEEMQCSSEVDKAVVKLKSGPVNEAALMQ